MTGRSAIVVGAGIAGLGAAWWLERAGWSVTVIERSADLRADGYMLSLSGPGYEVVRRMGLLPELQRYARPIHENIYRDRRGREILRMRYGELMRDLDWITLTRTDLVATLHKAVADFAPTMFGTTVTAVSEAADRVEATLSDGGRMTADLLIGADGTRSALRRLLFGGGDSALEPLGYRAAAFQIPDRLGIGEDFLSYAEPGRIAEIYTLCDGGLATLYAWRSDDAAPVAADDRRAVLRTAFDGAHPDVVQWLDALPADSPLYLDSLALVEQDTWSRGRTVLLGDAAHCLTLISGQGAGMALTSAAMLAEELGRHDMPQALTRHEARLRPSIERLQARSRKMAALFIPATPLTFALRNMVMRHLPRRLLTNYFLRAVKSEILLAGTGVQPIAREPGLRESDAE
jgi:2-polyprenyl-6-methoxyphenol hydroxylase-like FAD-dependent oxidoreductase